MSPIYFFLSSTVLPRYPLRFSRRLVLPLSRPSYEARWRRFDFAASLCARAISPRSAVSPPFADAACDGESVSFTQLPVDWECGVTWRHQTVLTQKLFAPEFVTFLLGDALLREREKERGSECARVRAYCELPLWFSSRFPSSSVSRPRALASSAHSLSSVQVRLRPREFATETPRW